MHFFGILDYMEDVSLEMTIFVSGKMRLRE